MVRWFGSPNTCYVHNPGKRTRPALHKLADPDVVWWDPLHPLVRLTTPPDPKGLPKRGVVLFSSMVGGANITGLFLESFQNPHPGQGGWTQALLLGLRLEGLEGIGIKPYGDSFREVLGKPNLYGLELTFKVSGIMCVPELSLFLYGRELRDS